MSKYTTEVRYLCESLSGLFPPKDYVSPLEYCKASVNKIFDSDIIENFNSVKHGDLLPNLLLHFYTREIGYEVYGLWRLNLNRILRENWYTYAALYETADMKIKIIDDVDYVREFEGVNESTSASKSKSNSSSTNAQTQKYSDTPQGELDGISTNKYLTNVTMADGNGENKSDSENDAQSKGENKSTERIRGKQGSKTYAAMLQEYRNAIYNVQLRIINDCETLFMQIW